MHKKSGFTLIELLVVIGIIALLSSIVLASLSTSRQKGNDAAKILALKQTMNALQLYVTANGYYPGGTQTTLTAALVPKYIGSIDPSILYQGLSITNTPCASNCPSYHVAVALSLTSNLVLSSDKNQDDTVNGGIINGKKDDCTSSGTGPSSPNLCYDITP
jgi:prepilin-type N-terminal cleavage/methylation domain-containing protein